MADGFMVEQTEQAVEELAAACEHLAGVSEQLVEHLGAALYRATRAWGYACLAAGLSQKMRWRSDDSVLVASQGREGFRTLRDRYRR